MKIRIQSFDFRSAIYRQQLGKLVGVILLVCGLQLYCPHTAAGEEGGAKATFTIFDPPDAGTGQFQGTFPTAISPATVITGYYLDANSVYHGFVRAPRGTFTSFRCSGRWQPVQSKSNPGPPGL